MALRNYKKQNSPKNRIPSGKDVGDYVSKTNNHSPQTEEAQFDLRTFARAIGIYLDKHKGANIEHNFILDDIRFLIEDYLSNFINKDNI